ncbi:MAG: hypothetical protein WCG05_04080 [Alphaproteobacteria bacterium]
MIERLKSYTKFLSVLLLLGVTNCATKRDPIPFNGLCFEKPSAVVIAEISGFDKAKYFKEGDQGFLDVLINDFFASSLNKRLERIDAKPIMNERFYEFFAKRFQENNFKVIKCPHPLNRKDLSSIDKANYAPYDFMFLREKYEAEYALIVEPKSFGLTRNYYGFIPTSAPYGHVSLLVYLVRLEDNSLEAYYMGAFNGAVNGDWDTPPEYAGLMTAVEDTLKTALNGSHQHFFNEI